MDSRLRFRGIAVSFHLFGHLSGFAWDYYCTPVQVACQVHNLDNLGNIGGYLVLSLVF